MGELENLVSRGFLKQGDTTPNAEGAALERDPYAPDFELIIYGGQGAQPFTITDEIKKYITEITYEDNADQFDKLTIHFENQMDNQGGGDINSIIDSVIFAEGHVVQLKLGYGRMLESVGACDIVKKEPDFPENGSPSLIVTCFDGLHRVSRHKPIKGTSFINYRVSDIAYQIGTQNGLIVDAVDAQGNPTIQEVTEIWKGDAQKKGVSDYVFLKKVADTYGLDLFCRFDPIMKKHVLYLQTPGTELQKEVFTFVYNEGDASYQNTLLSFNPTQDSYDQDSEIEVFILTKGKKIGTKTDFITKLTVDEQKKLKDNSERRFTGGNKATGKQIKSTDGIEVGFKAFGRSFRFPKHKRFTDEKDIVREIENFVKRQKSHFITGNASTIGVEVMQSRQVHNFQGVSEQFSGKYFMDKVLHKISKSSGYKCDVTVRRMIEDSIVQAPPTLNFSEVDKTIKAIKGLFSG